MVYDVSTNRELKGYIDKAITTSEQRTKAELDNLRFAMDNLKLAMELTIQRQFGELAKVVRSDTKARAGEQGL